MSGLRTSIRKEKRLPDHQDVRIRALTVSHDIGVGDGWANSIPRNRSKTEQFTR